MATQTTYPGVYIEEFTPGSPIEGVSTSVAAFIGVSALGPINEPTRITSWDEYVARFGPPSFDHFLGKSVEGFFRNGGNVCWIVRASDKKAGVPPPLNNGAGKPVFSLEARPSSTATGQIDVTITHSSRLADALLGAGANRTTLKSVENKNPLSKVTALDAARRTLTVDNDPGVAVGDRLVLDNGTTTELRTVEAVTMGAAPAPKTVRVDRSLPNDPSWKTATCAIDQARKGDRRIRLENPSKLPLNSVLPPGTVVGITGNGADEVGIVRNARADGVIELDDALRNDRPLGFTVASLEFNLQVQSTAGSELFEYLSTSPLGQSYWGDISSQIVRLSPPATIDRGQGDPRPAPTVTQVAALADDPGGSWTSITTSPDQFLQPLLAQLAEIDDISIVAMPGATAPAVQTALIDHCERLGDRVAVLDAPPGVGLDQAIAHRQSIAVTTRGFGSLFYPWITLRNPETRREQAWPPSGHVAGVYAKTDITRGVHKAPANVALAGALGLERRVNDIQQGLLNPEGVNVIRTLPGRAVPVVWGARTVTTIDRNWQYTNIRRLFNYLEESIAEGISWAVFEPNNLALWQKLRRTITEFLTRAWRDGALFGETPREAFYVRIDEALNPESERRLGRLYIEVGVRPSYPAEFIIVRIGIWDGGVEFQEN